MERVALGAAAESEGMPGAVVRVAAYGAARSVVGGALAGLFGSGGGFRREGVSRREEGAGSATTGRVPLEDGSTPSECR